MIDGKSFIVEELKEEPLDTEIKKLVYLINQVDGVETINSCFGHHEMPCRIWLRIKDVNTANKFIRRFFYLDPLWSLKLTFSEAGYFEELLFIIESVYQDYPTVDLMVESLTKRFEERIESESESEVKPKETLMEQDSADVRENIPIKFIPLNVDCKGYTETFRCSKCGCDITASYVMRELDYDFCPWCGGKAE